MSWHFFTALGQEKTLDAIQDTLKANIASPAFTGVPTAPTAAPNTNNTQLATTAYADAPLPAKANLASPVFTGVVTAPILARPVVATLPTVGLVEGQECFFQDANMGNAGIIWHLRYRSGIGDAYKWEYVGGGPLHAEVIPNQSTGSGTFTDLATSGPSVTLPWKGVYRWNFGANVSSAWGLFAPIIPGAADAIDNDTVQVNGAQASGAREIIRTATVAGASRLRYRASGTAFFQFRFITVTPVRIG